MIQKIKNTLSRAILFLLITFGATCFNAQKVNTSLTYSVIQPAIKSTKVPVLIILHGYGSNENDFLDFAKEANNKFIKFTLRAPNVMQGSGNCWYELNFLTNGSYTYDYEQVKKSRAKVLSFISQACKTFNVDSTQVYLMGFSQGAIMCYELALFAPTKIKAIIPISGRLMEESKAHKTNVNELSKLSVFIGHGTKDERIKSEESDKAAQYLKSKKINVMLKKYNIPHTLSGEEIEDIKSFLVNGIAY
jgi:phospholipase/carboxylesterase